MTADPTLQREHRELLIGALARVEQVEAEVARYRAPAAVLGIGLRLPPDVADLDSFWEMLQTGKDAVALLGTEPGPGRRGGDIGEPCGALTEIEGFDAPFFGIGPAEASRMDPQQRILLETAWESIEDAGIPVEVLRGSRTGVYIGAYSNDYLVLQQAAGATPDAFTGPGLAHSMLANRLSYLLDLHGPSLTVDTACSSSLTALHLGLRALRAGDCEYAVVAGVNVVLSPASSAVTREVLPVSPTGRCHSFDAAADGIVRGEGCVAVVLSMDVRQGGPKPRALLAGTAINHNGRGNGLIAPNPVAQTAVVRAALADASLAADQVRYVETHGTGTRLGDPIEVDALAEVYGHRDNCLLGSVKSSLGHLEAAAGLVGLAKAVAVLERGLVPAQPFFDKPNPELSLDAGLAVPAEATTLPDGAAVAVSSFGFGGANGHAVLAAKPATPTPREDADAEAALLVLPLDARSSGALSALRTRWADLLDGADTAAPARLCAAAAQRRSRMPYRCAASGRNIAELVTDLRRPMAPPAPASQPPAPVLVFSGQGTQWAGMGRQLVVLPELAERMNCWDNEVQAAAGWSLVERLCDPDDDFTATEHAQICIGVIQLALAGLLADWGVRPRAVVGHSMGEAVAACVAGMISSRDMFVVLAERSRVIEDRARGGAMVALDICAAAAEAMVSGADGVGVAALNSNDRTVLAGPAAAIERVRASAADRGIRATPLRGAYAFHSPMLNGADAELTARLERLLSPARPGMVQFHSTVTGARLTHVDAAHWGRNVRDAVRFADALESALGADTDVPVIEVSPHPALAAAITQSPAVRRGPVLTTLRRGVDIPAALAAFAGELHVAGYDLAWDRIMPCSSVRLSLPHYPWQRTPYWFTNVDAAPPKAAGAAVTGAAVSVDELAEFFRDGLCRVVGRSADITVETSLRDIDIDSLTIVELKNRAERAFNIDIPLSALLAGWTLAELAGAALTAVDDDAVSQPETTEFIPEDPAALLARLDDLPDDEVRRLLELLTPQGDPT